DGHKPLKTLDRDHGELFGPLWSALLLALLVHPPTLLVHLHPPPFALPIGFAVRPLALPSEAFHGGHDPVLFGPTDPRRFEAEGIVGGLKENTHPEIKEISNAKSIKFFKF